MARLTLGVAGGAADEGPEEALPNVLVWEMAAGRQDISPVAATSGLSTNGEGRLGRECFVWFPSLLRPAPLLVLFRRLL